MKLFNKSLLKYLIVSVCVLVLLCVLLWSAVMFFTSEFFYSFLPYDTVDQWILYDHIEYNGDHYYCYDADLIPNGVMPDFYEKISITIVNSKCEPYDETRHETAYLCQNDDNRFYIYYGSCYFTCNKSLAQIRE